MDQIFEALNEWLADWLSEGIMDHLSWMFEFTNRQVGLAGDAAAMTPEAFSPGIFSMVRAVSETVILPIAGMILTCIACIELIQMVIDQNSMRDYETWNIFRWAVKTAVAVIIITNTFNVTMAVFEAAGAVVRQSTGLISGSTAIDASALDTMAETIEEMDAGPLFAMYLQMFLVHAGMNIMAIAIYIIVYGRLIEIYLMTSLAPIPMATFGGRESRQIGQNFIRSLFALGLQGFLIIICIGIYAVLIQSIDYSGDDIMGAVWTVAGFTALLCFTLFKTSGVAKSVLNAR